MAVTVSLSSPSDSAVGVTSNVLTYIVGGTGTYNATEILVNGAQYYYLEHSNLLPGTKTFNLTRADFIEGETYTWQVKVKDTGSGVWKESETWSFTCYLTDIDSILSYTVPTDGESKDYREFSSVIFGLTDSVVTAKLYGGYTLESLAYVKDFTDISEIGTDWLASGLDELIDPSPSNGDTWYWAIAANLWWTGEPPIASSTFSIAFVGPPAKPTNPTPTDAGTGIKLGLATLTWEAG